MKKWREFMIYDVAVLGGGVVGCAILNKLTRIGKKTVLIEKNSDVATETSKANSGIVHAGFDAMPGTLKAKLNVRGAELMPKLCRELGVKLVNNGAVVIGNDQKTLEDLLARGIQNGVTGLEILDREKLSKLLPAITDEITCGLLAKTSCIVSPYKLTIALAEEAVLNGADVVFNYDTKACNKVDNYYVLDDGKTKISAYKIVIACGGEHNQIANILGAKQYDIKYRRGEYFLLEKNSCDINGLTVFPMPSKDSKGVLVSYTVSNNIIVGPTSILCDNNLTVTTNEGLDDIASKVGHMLSNVNLKKNIRIFSGVRTLVGHDFVIEKDENNPDFVDVTGICSPGLSASPAIAEEVVKLLGFDLTEKTNLVRRKECPKIAELSSDELSKLIKKDPNFGKIVCRCEMVSVAEIIDAVNSPLKPISLDGIKRRTRAGMGRCQGGFCFMKVMEIISKVRGISIDEVTKENMNSRIIVGNIK
ncbi:MAG: FAD-dependent oxidoreductase [Firmicutes bacterium]|nr:FAD-dependent oxidoreductase [Bacillota bacterium]